jgi:hypothetical protein
MIFSENPSVRRKSIVGMSGDLKILVTEDVRTLRVSHMILKRSAVDPIGAFSVLHKSLGRRRGSETRKKLPAMRIIAPGAKR